MTDPDGTIQVLYSVYFKDRVLDAKGATIKMKSVQMRKIDVPGPLGGCLHPPEGEGEGEGDIAHMNTITSAHAPVQGGGNSWTPAVFSYTPPPLQMYQAQTRFV